MAAQVFRGIGNGRNLWYVVRDINEWLDELGEDYRVCDIQSCRTKEPDGETIVWVNAERLPKDSEGGAQCLQEGSLSIAFCHCAFGYPGCFGIMASSG